MADEHSGGDVHARIRDLAREVSGNHESLDVDDLDDDATFTRLVELLADRRRTPDDVFGSALQDPSVWVRSAAYSAIARGRTFGGGWSDRATKRFRRAGYDESCFLLRALARSDQPVLKAILAHVEDSWSGGMIVEKVAEFVDARVERGERLTVADLTRLDVDVQPVVEELVAKAAPGTRAVLGPPVEEWRLESIDIDFFKELGRIVEPGEHPSPTIVGSRALAVDAVVSALTAARPKSILLVGEEGVGKTTLIVEALRRVEASRFRLAFQATAADVNAGQMYIGMLEARVQEIVAKLARRPIVWVFPNLEDSLWSGTHTQSPRGLLDALLPAVESGDVTIMGEVDPLAYELLIQNRPRVVRLFDVIRLAPMTDDETLAVGRGWANDNEVDVDAKTLAEALDLATHYLPATAAPGNLLRLLGLVRDRIDRGLAAAVTPETIIATLSEATGLPLHVLDPRAPLDLADVRRFFESRVLGQPDAVTCLVERIALVKAGLTDPTRPLGVFLFVGPTGTGKTEIAKALGAFLFGSEDRLVRLDMSEYQTPESLERLLGDATTQTEAAPLIAAVRRAAVLRAPPRRVREGRQQRLGRLPAGLRRRPPDRQERAHRRPAALRDHPDLESRLGDPERRAARLRRGLAGLRARDGAEVRPAVVPPRVPEPARPRRRLPSAGPGDDAGAARERAQRRPAPPGAAHAAVGGRVGRGRRRLPDRARIQRRARRAPAEAGGRAAPAHPHRHDHRRAQVPRGRPVPLHHGRRGGLEVTFVDPELAEDEPAATPAGGDLTVAAIALDPQGSAAETECLKSELARVSDSIREWEDTKSEALEAMRAPHFWESDERHGVLSRIEYLDRLSAAGATAQRLAARLDTGRETQSRELVGMLARRLHVLDAAVRGLEAGEPADAEIVIRAAHGDDSPAAEAVVDRLAAMYAAWADARGMRAHRHDAERGQALTVTGLGAFTLLRPEAGLHVFEVPTRERSFDRVAALVTVAPRDHEARPGDADLPPASEPTIVRRYREAPSPLVRDASGARTGRIDRVLGGDFDLIGETASAGA